MLTVWNMQAFTLLDILSPAFLRYDVTNVNSSVFLIRSFKAFKNIQDKNVNIPTLKAATVNADGHIFFFFQTPQPESFEICNWCEQ